jgi:hypothetical protein
VKLFKHSDTSDSCAKPSVGIKSDDGLAAQVRNMVNNKSSNGAAPKKSGFKLPTSSLKKSQVTITRLPKFQFQHWRLCKLEWIRKSRKKYFISKTNQAID